jgi:hypothetical protein
LEDEEAVDVRVRTPTPTLASTPAPTPAPSEAGGVPATSSPTPGPQTPVPTEPEDGGSQDPVTTPQPSSLPSAEPTTDDCSTIGRCIAKVISTCAKRLHTASNIACCIIQLIHIVISQCKLNLLAALTI